jgi:hypothetical protein
MNTIQQALKAIEASEKELRKLIELAVGERRYTDVSRLAELAEILGKAIEKCTTKSASDAVSGADAEERQAIAVSPILPPDSKQVRRQKTSDYPKFEIDRDRLVKLGWSKKDRQVYEHRVAREQAFSVCEKLFKMEEVLPVILEDGSEIPLYQAYLVLAWLRHLGFIAKQGKDGYQWRGNSFDQQEFDTAWRSTSSRSTI